MPDRLTGKRRGGIRPFQEAARHGPIALGEAVVTSAGRLPFKAIIHVAGIDMPWRASERSIRGSVRSAMALVDAGGFASDAFPVVGAGSGSFSPDAALRLMVDEFGKLQSRAQARIVRFQPRARQDA